MSGKIKILIIVLIFAIIGIGVTWGIHCKKSKIQVQEQLDEAQRYWEEMVEQEKNTNQIDNSINSQDTEKTTKYILNGEYEWNYPDDYVGIKASFIFKDNTVTCISDGTRVGTYTIEGNKLTVIYNKAYSPEDNNKELDEFAKGPFTFEIINNEKFIDDNGDEFLLKTN